LKEWHSLSLRLPRAIDPFFVRFERYLPETAPRAKTLQVGEKRFPHAIHHTAKAIRNGEFGPNDQLSRRDYPACTQS
jgi:hypothetical protein